MKRFSLAVFAFLLGGAVAFAQAPAAGAAAAGQAPKAPAVPPCTKIGLIDFRTALMDSDPGKSAQKEFDKGMTDSKTSLEKLEKDINDLQTKLQNAKTDAEKSDLTKQLEAKNREGQRTQEDAQRLSQELQDKLLPPVAKMEQEALDKYSKDNCLAVVFDPTQEPTNIVYASMAMDITSEIMRMINAEFAKNPAAAKPAATPATPPKQ